MRLHHFFLISSCHSFYFLQKLVQLIGPNNCYKAACRLLGKEEGVAAWRAFGRFWSVRTRCLTESNAYSHYDYICDVPLDPCLGSN